DLLTVSAHKIHPTLPFLHFETNSSSAIVTARSARRSIPFLAAPLLRRPRRPAPGPRGEERAAGALRCCAAPAGVHLRAVRRQEAGHTPHLVPLRAAQRHCEGRGGESDATGPARCSVACY